MQITFNKSRLTIENSSTLDALLKIQRIVDTEGIAVAVNQRVVPKSRWKEHCLKENDTVILVTATQGG